ncbi:thiamine pyrophosphokinase [Bacteroidia bacterium]|nr:thiamine pyrophosphokinase [Bacteroidia bacterium]GHT82474.1 thiamine pyrophosphokinase [Bacteroidia bacterium]
MITLVQHYPTVVLADGDFPTGSDALQALREAKNIVCCDGAVTELLHANLLPTAIVGDMDSLPNELQQRFANITHRITEQENNDLTKAVHFCVAQGMKQITVLGATGKREDHTVGNISLLAKYAYLADIQMITNYGVFVAISKSAELESFAGQQVSIFALQPDAKITSQGLKYPLQQRPFTSWWQGTLNEAEGSSFSLQFERGDLLVYRELRGIR